VAARLLYFLASASSGFASKRIQEFIDSGSREATIFLDFLVFLNP
jgi:hypothetical protein